MRQARHLGVYAGGGFELVPSEAKEYQGSTERSVNAFWIGQVSGFAGGFNCRYKFVPTGRAKKVTVELEAEQCYISSSPTPRFLAAISTDGAMSNGTEFEWNATTKKASVEISGNFTKGTTYYLRVWMDSVYQGYVTKVTADKVKLTGR